MQITFLGTGTSIGVPSVGCDCDVCQSEDPRNKRLRSSIHVAAPDCQWVVDTGPDFRQQCLREQITELDAVLYTHAHMDHIVGFDDLRRFTLGREAFIPIYGTQPCLDDLKRMFAYAFDVKNHYPGYLKPRPHVIDGPFQLGETRLELIPVTHGNVPTVGYLFERPNGKRLAYISDCKSISDAVVESLTGVDILVLDALRFTVHPTHLNFEEALALQARIGSGQTWFTHFSCEVDHKNAQAGLPKGVDLAYDGLKITL